MEKDYKALMNAKDRYEQNILELKNEKNFYQFEIQDMNYSLHGAIIALKEELNNEYTL